jgi:hypothetical protein
MGCQVTLPVFERLNSQESLCVTTRKDGGLILSIVSDRPAIGDDGRGKDRRATTPAVFRSVKCIIYDIKYLTHL